MGIQQCRHTGNSLDSVSVHRIDGTSLSYGRVEGGAIREADPTQVGVKE